MRVIRLSIFCLLWLNLFSRDTFAQGTAVPSLMNFQGRLAKPDGTPVADGNVNLQFALFNAPAGGTLLWQRSVPNIPVHNGTFTTRFDFSGGFQNGATLSSLFGASALYLEISVNGGAPLTPRQQLVTVAYAMKANSVPDGSIGTAQIATGAVTASKIANGAVGTNPLANSAVTGSKIAAGTITADKFAAGLFNSIVWLLNGNSGTNGAQFLGTTDNQPLVFKANNRRAMQYQYAEATNEFRSINVSGGSEINEIGAGVVAATIAGGGADYFTGLDYPNRVLANFGTVGGGIGNIASGNSATVGGGYSNTANGLAATVGGGFANTASGNYSFAAGLRAQANHNGAFVWADSIGVAFPTFAANEFRIRATGGFRFFTNSALSTGVTLIAGDSTWNSVSDRNAKTAIIPVDPQDVLERLLTIPVATWNYKNVENPLRHIGPMAQDFYAAYQVGADDKHISTIDADGVALAAIQGLHAKHQKELNALKAENAQLKTKNAAMEARFAAIEQALAELKGQRK